jgi:hypothetical protein
MLNLPQTKPAFEFGCSLLPFDAMEYWILTRQGLRLDALLHGAVTPHSRNECYFLRCIREDADYDSHQCLEAEAWRKWIERRAFEAEHPAPQPNRTWIRTCELREGMILLRAAKPVLLETTSSNRARREPREHSNAVKQPRRPCDEHGAWRSVTDLATGARSEIYVSKGEMHQVADGFDRVMTYIWRDNLNDDLLVLDPATEQTMFLPMRRVSHDAEEPGRLHSEQPIRVQWWEGEPVWVWGAK